MASYLNIQKKNIRKSLDETYTLMRSFSNVHIILMMEDDTTRVLSFFRLLSSFIL